MTSEAFYSQLSRAVAGAPDKVFGKGGQVKSWLQANASKLGVKQDEIVWSGVVDWLDLQDGKVTKDQVLGYLDANSVRDAKNKKKPQELKNKAIELYADGLTSGAVASSLNIGETTVLRWVKGAGITRTVAETKGVTSEKIENAVKYYQEGNSVFESSKKAGIGNSTLFRVLQARDLTRMLAESTNIPEAIKKQAIDLFASGMTSYEVADQLSLTQPTVSKWVRDAGVSRGYSGAQALRVANGRLTGYGIKTKFNSAKNNTALNADSVYELARFYQLESDVSVKSFSRSKDRIPYGENSTYVPDIEIIYKDGSKVVEEIKPAFKVEDEKVQAKVKGAEQYYSNKDIVYRIITENDIGIDNFNKVVPESAVDSSEDITRVKASLASVRWALRIPAMREQIMGRLPLFSQDIGNYSQGLSIDLIDAEIARFKSEWTAMPDVIVVQSVDSLPFEAPVNADGAYYDGKVYVVASNIRDIKQLQKVMAHECVLHHSLQDMLGDYGFSKLHAGIQGLKAAGDPTVVALAANILGRYGVLPPEVETKEIIARAGELCLDDTGNVRIEYGFMKSVYAGVAGWLRDQGFKVAFTNVELQGIMHDAGEWIKRDVGRDYAGRLAPVMSLGVGEAIKTALGAGQESVLVDGVDLSAVNSAGKPIHWSVEGVENFWRGFGDSKAVDGEGRPLVVFHGTGADFNEFRSGQGIFGRGMYFAKDIHRANDYGNNIYEVYLTLRNPYEVLDINSLEDDYKDADGNVDTTSLIEDLKSSGYDGIIIKDPIEDTIVAFEPSQIKSAVGNNGDFDLSSNSILFSLNDIKLEGSFSGRVLDVANGVVVQKIGRDPDIVVRHDILKLNNAVNIGDVVHIKYKNGFAAVFHKNNEISR